MAGALALGIQVLAPLGPGAGLLETGMLLAEMGVTGMAYLGLARVLGCQEIGWAAEAFRRRGKARPAEGAFEIDP